MEQGIKDYLKKLRNTFTKVKNKDKKVLVNQYLDVLIKLFRNLDFLSKFKRVIKKIISLIMRGLNIEDQTIADMKKEMANNLNDILKIIIAENERLKENYGESSKTIAFYNNYFDLPGTDHIRRKKQKLSNIASTISTRDRLIQINEEQAKLNNDRIMSLRKIYFPILIGTILCVALGLSVGLKEGIIGFGVVMGMYLVYVLYKFNFLNIRNIFTPEVSKIKQVLRYADEKLDDELALIRQRMIEYSNENCKCPDNDNKREKMDEYDGKKIVAEKSSDEYYYDGTAPAQMYDKNGMLIN